MYKKKHLVGIVAMGGLRSFEAYRFWIKEEKKQPTQLLSVKFSDDIRGVHFVLSLGVFVLMEKSLEYYRLSWNYERVMMQKCFGFKYKIDPNRMQLYRVPQPVHNTLNIYFEQGKNTFEERNKFGLWMQSFRVPSNRQQPVVGQLIRLYNIDLNLRDTISLFNYNSQICLVEFQNKLMAFKNGYIIDAVNTNIRQQNYFIKYVPASQKLFHFLDKVIDVYDVSMDEHTKP